MDITVGSNNSLNIIIKYVKLLLDALRVATHKSTIMACSRGVPQMVDARREYVASGNNMRRMCM